MGKFQGHKRLTEGYSRNLTKSEVARGYIFISNDQEVRKLGDVEIFVNGKGVGDKKVDGSGRVSVGQKLTHDIGEKICNFKLEGTKISLRY